MADKACTSTNFVLEFCMLPGAIRGNEDAATGEVSLSLEERSRLDGLREFVWVRFLGGMIIGKTIFKVN